MGILDELLESIIEEADPTTPPPAAKEGKEDEQDADTWYSDEFKSYANIS